MEDQGRRCHWRGQDRCSDVPTLPCPGSSSSRSGASQETGCPRRMRPLSPGRTACPPVVSWELGPSSSFKWGWGRRAPRPWPQSPMWREGAEPWGKQEESRQSSGNNHTGMRGIGSVVTGPGWSSIQMKRFSFCQGQPVEQSSSSKAGFCFWFFHCIFFLFIILL